MATCTVQRRPPPWTKVWRDTLRGAAMRLRACENNDKQRRSIRLRRMGGHCAMTESLYGRLEDLVVFRPSARNRITHASLPEASVLRGVAHA